jgi:hypothetical protein
MLSLDDTSAMKQIRASGLYITCLKIIKLVIGNKSMVPKICTRYEEGRLQTLCLFQLQVFAYGGGGEGVFGTIYNLFQINWELEINQSFHIYGLGLMKVGLRTSFLEPFSCCLSCARLIREGTSPNPKPTPNTNT